jgi:hypothetical protein
MPSAHAVRMPSASRPYPGLGRLPGVPHAPAAPACPPSRPPIREHPAGSPAALCVMLMILSPILATG